MKKKRLSSLKKTFNAEAAVILRDFSAAKNMCALIVMTPKKTLSFAQKPEVKKKVLNKVIRDSLWCDEFYFARNPDTSARLGKEDTLSYGDVYKVLLSDKRRSRREHMFLFDHEIGHLVTRRGTGNTLHVKENAADAYAYLRQIQRYKSFYRHPHNIVATDALGVLDEDRKKGMGYFNPVVFQAVARLSATGALASMNHQETAALADTLAEKYNLTEATLESTWQEFAAPRYSFKYCLNDEDFFEKFYGQIADILDKTHIKPAASIALVILEDREKDLRHCANKDNDALVKVVAIMDKARAYSVPTNFAAAIDCGEYEDIYTTPLVKRKEAAAPLGAGFNGFSGRRPTKGFKPS